MRGVTVTLLFACGLTMAAAIADQGDADKAQPVHYQVTRATSPIEIDGEITEQAWADALSVELNYEVRPGENIAPPVRTECLITYDERRVYFAFRAHDPDPSRIRARFSDRDRAWNDDWVGVVLDTFNDERRAYELFSNPLGVQIDAINDDVGGNYDDSWNAFWDSAGKITAQGYQVEMAIPFSQIRFQAVNGSEALIWGFDAIRSYPRGDRHHIGLFPRDRGNNSYLSQAAKLEGMNGAEPGRNLELIPTLTGSRSESRTDFPYSPLDQTESNAELGVSVRWGITPNMSLNGAINPDFSQVEADAVQLDINQQFALFFRETRPFFLEGADYFNTGLNLVHTRTIADPTGAVKLTGKSGRHTYGVFTAQDEQTNLIFPGAEGSSSGIFDIETTNTVGRYRFDFGSNSTVGATITDRRGDDYENQVVSVDSVYRITDADSVRFNYAHSNTRYDQAMITEFELQKGSFSDDALRVSYNHSVRGWWTNFRYEDFGAGYRSDLGFRPQVDVTKWVAGGAKVLWGDEDSFFNRIGVGGDIDRAETQSGELLEEEVETWLNLDGPKQSFTYVGFGNRTRVFEGVEFDQWFQNFFFGFEPNGNTWLGFNANFGDAIDFDHTRPADRMSLRPEVRYNLGRHLLVRYVHTYLTLDVEGGQLFRIHVPEARVVYQFNTKAYVRMILQYTDIKRDISLYEDKIEPRTKDLLTQILFAYKLNPQTAIYVGYTGGFMGDQRIDLTEADRVLFTKLSYAWVR